MKSAPSSGQKLQAKTAVYSYGDDDSRVAYDFIVRRDNKIHRSMSFPCVEVKDCWELPEIQVSEESNLSKQIDTKKSYKDLSSSSVKSDGDFWAPQELTDDGGFSEMSERVKDIARLDVTSRDKNAIKERSNLFQSMYQRPADFYETIRTMDHFPKPKPPLQLKPKVKELKRRSSKPTSLYKVPEMGLLCEREPLSESGSLTPNNTSALRDPPQSEAVVGFQYRGKLKQALVEGDSQLYLKEIERLEVSNTNL